MLNMRFLACTKIELWDLTVFIAINLEKNQSRAMTLTCSDNAKYRTCLSFSIYYNVFKYHVSRLISF